MKSFVSLLLFAAAAAGYEPIPVESLRPTTSGVTLVFRVPNTFTCSVKIFKSTGDLVDDTNERFFPGSAYCGRPGSYFSGNQVTFNAGGGGVAIGVDGKYHARSLETNKVYRFEIESGGQKTSGWFATAASPALIASVLPSIGPMFTYAKGAPSYCSMTAGFPVPAICTAPGELPVGSFPTPAPGGSYIDANFGAAVRTLTPGGSYRHAYSTPGAMSTTGRYTLIADDVFSTILDTASALPVRQKARAYRTWTSGEVIWDPTQDDVLYYFSRYWNGSTVVADRLMRYQVSTDSESVFADYSKPPYNFTNVFRGGTGDMSRDGWLPFLTDTKAVCVVQVLPGRAFHGQTFCADYGAAGGLGWTVVDFVSITKGPDRATGMHYLVVQGGPANAVFQFDSTRALLTFQFRGPDVPASLAGNSNGNGICEPGETCLSQAHSDTLEDSQGGQYLVRTMQIMNPCSQVLTAIRLSAGTAMLRPVQEGGGRKDIVTLGLCGNVPWPSIHVGCARRAPLCAVSLENAPKGLPASFRDGAPYNGEIWVVRGTGEEIRRVAMHRSVIRKYYDQPRVTLSDFGHRVIWGTNFGHAVWNWVVAAETGMR